MAKPSNSGSAVTRKPMANVSSAPTRRERLESKEGAIVNAAYEMFAQKGFAKSTIMEIARSAGVAEGTVYLYFNNKEALASAVIASFYERLTKAARKGVDRCETATEKLQFLADHHLSSVLEERRILELLSILDRHVKSESNSSTYKMNKHYVAIFDSVVREGVLRGEIADGYTPWAMRDIFYGGLDYAVRTILLTGRQSQAKDFTMQLVRLVTTSLKSGISSQSDDISDHRQDKLTKLADRMDEIVDRMEMVLSDDKPSRQSIKK